MTTPLTLALLVLAPASGDELLGLEDVLEPVRAEHGVPALAAGVLHGSELGAIGAVGVRALGSEAKVTRDDLWHLGSCTKAMTATLLAVLAEKEVLALDDTLDLRFPELSDEMQDDWRHVTLADLLRHRGGVVANPLRIWGELSAHPDGVGGARAMLVRETLLAPPATPPGKYVYSNAGYVVVGAAAERATGQPWEELLREHVFAPLGMTSAGFGPPGSADALDQPRGHRPQRGGGLEPVPPGPGADNPAWLGPAGTVHATLADWARFLALHLAGARGEETPLLAKASFERLHSVPEGGDYASGWIVQPRDWAEGDVLIHNGSNTMWYCTVFVAPERDLALFAACNQAGQAGALACDSAVVAAMELWDARE